MKRTPLHAAHQALGARFVDFGGWEMPVQYTGVIEEHQAVRQRAGARLRPRLCARCTTSGGSKVAISQSKVDRAAKGGEGVVGDRLSRGCCSNRSTLIELSTLALERTRGRSADTQ